MAFGRTGRANALSRFSSTDFGHIENNTPLGIGAEATIDENELKWHFQADAS